MLRVLNPANGSLIQELEEDSPAAVHAKFLQAKEAQKSWADTPLAERLEILGNFRNLVERRLEELAKTLSLEVGKPIRQSRNELKALLSRLDFFAEAAPLVLGEEKVFIDALSKLEERIAWEPLGVIANISAWNYPYFVGSNVYVPALLGGNAVLYKPSEFSSLSGLAMAELWKDAGLPEGLFLPLIGGPATGGALLEQKTQGIFFTGSYKTGALIAAAAAKRMVKMQLELGGKDPVYVCADADVVNAAKSLADGAFYNNGQSCCSVERLYVEAPIYDAFLKAFCEEVKSFKMGNPLDEGTYLGPLTRPAQIGVLESQIKDAEAKGAKRELGGKRLSGPGSFFEATVFSQVDHTMALMQEESFGPLIGIQKVENDEEALWLMNDTEYGLTAGVYTPDAARATAILEKVNSGSVYWNCCDRVSPRLPWSGRGHSGLGTVLSKQGILTFVQPKAWHLRAG